MYFLLEVENMKSMLDFTLKKIKTGLVLIHDRTSERRHLYSRNELTGLEGIIRAYQYS